jgi:pyridoxamine 5'-phosphate oxidase
MMNRDLADMRVNYQLQSLDIEDVKSDPLDQFIIWFDQARNADLKEPNAMILSTVDQNNQPDARTVLLKDIIDGQFVFYSNYESKKGQDLTANEKCALTFLWLDLERQVRIKGNCTKLDKEISTKYFQSRPRESQLGAWSSPQSQQISNRNILESKYAELEQKFKNLVKLPIPEFWGGYIVDPFEIEFWQGRSSRLHDRIFYKKQGKGWEITRLAP